MPDPAAPLEADLGQATDAEWQEAHQALTALLAGTDFPAEELAHIWDPALDADTLLDPSEVDHGPSYIEAAPDGTP